MQRACITLRCSRCSIASSHWSLRQRVGLPRRTAGDGPIGRSARLLLAVLLRHRHRSSILMELLLLRLRCRGAILHHWDILLLLL